MKAAPTEVAEISADLSFYCFCCLSSLTECDVTIGSTNNVIFGVGFLQWQLRGVFKTCLKTVICFAVGFDAPNEILQLCIHSTEFCRLTPEMNAENVKYINGSANKFKTVNTV